MEIWIIKNGEKTGPIHDYEIRGRIQRGEIEPEEKIWHDGLAEWTEAGKIELFRKEFDMDRALPEPPALPKEYLEQAKTDAEKSRPKAHISRRFWARWLDLTVYAAVWWLGMYFSGRDIASTILNPWMLLSIYIPWFMVEAWLIHRYGFTLGKWLMGLRVRNEDDSLLSLKASMWRAIRVLISGIGFGWQLLSPLCQVMSWFTTRRIGKPIWDYLGGHKVVAEPLNPLKLGALVFLFFCAIQLQFAVRWPHEKVNWMKAYPESKEMFENDEIWTFPVKKQ